jgi:UDP-N-acetylglucosamine:LPS N-acetylglucosamine transferase
MRVLVLSAEIGEGHMTAARALVAKLARRPEVEAVELRADLGVLGPRFGAFMTRGFHTHLEDAGWSYELAYRVFFQLGPPRRVAQRVLGGLGAGGLRGTVADYRADLVIAEFPVLSAALGELRARGRLSVPVCSSISDPAGLHYWVHPGIDLHLLSWPEAIPEAERIAGPGRAVAVRPMIDERFIPGPPRSEARTRLKLPPTGTVVTVSGGGWGVGDVGGAVSAVSAELPQATVIALAGRSESLKGRLEAVYAGRPQVRVLGFTDRMPDLLAASDALIHTTGGTTALEARVMGCPLINYGRGVAHVRAHARAMARQGLAEWARRRDELPGALRRTLGAGRPAPQDVSGYPDPAEVVVALGRNSSGRGSDSATQQAAARSASAAGPGA